MTNPKRSSIVSGLIAKRAELAGVIIQLQQQLHQDRADLSHIDGVLRILATDIDPETIKPKRRVTPTECRPFLGHAVSSMIRASIGPLRSIAGGTISPTLPIIAASDYGAFPTK